MTLPWNNLSHTLMVRVARLEVNLSHRISFMATETDPRFQRSREAILTAARRLLIDLGPAFVTHAHVAEHAGVGRATVYRHWPRPDQLLAAVMATAPLPFFAVPTLPTRDWIRGELLAMAAELDLAEVRVVASTLANAAEWDSEMDARRAGFAQMLTSRLSTALQQADERGEVRLRLDVSSAAALLIGPIYYRATIERANSGVELVDVAIEGLGTWT